MKTNSRWPCFYKCWNKGIGTNKTLEVIGETINGKQPDLVIMDINMSDLTGIETTYKQLKKQNPNFNTFDFRVLQYEKYF
jgi:CheY-like chemotaxis protein